MSAIGHAVVEYQSTVLIKKGDGLEAGLAFITAENRLSDGRAFDLQARIWWLTGVNSDPVSIVTALKEI